MASSSIAGLRQYVVTLDEFVDQKHEAGRGAYGTVYKSTINGARCVVKKLHDILTGTGGQERVSQSQWRELVEKFIREIELLSQQRHPNIVQFLGVCNIDGDPRDICLVMEQLDINLNGFIETNKSNISLPMKLSILRDVCCGVGHLHASGIVHRDLNAGNVLLSTGLQAKVADLGVSRIIDPGSVQQYLSSRAPGALDYMPPETLQENPKYGLKMDSFSFGHLALYFVIETYPHPKELTGADIDLNRGEDNELLNSLQVQKRKKWMPQMGMDHPLDSMVKSCLNDSVEKRPSMKELREQLEEKIQAHGSVPSVMELSSTNNEQGQMINTLTSQIEDNQETIHRYEDELEDNQETIHRYEDELEDNQDTILNNQQMMLEYDETIEGIQEKMCEYEDEIKDSRNKVCTYRKEIEDNQEKMQGYKEEIKSNWKRIECLREEKSTLVEAFQKDLKKMSDEKMHFQNILSKLDQEKNEFLLTMGKKSLDEVQVSYMNMESFGEGLQLQVSYYKEQVRHLECKLGELRHVLIEKLDQEPHDAKAPPYIVQKAEIRPLMSQELKLGDEWYLVDHKWLKQWKTYTGYDLEDKTAGDDTYKPGPVYNSTLLEGFDDNVLKDGLQEGVDYELVPKSAWDKLISWYSLTPQSKPICRRVTKYGMYVQHLEVEVYMINVKVCVYPRVYKVKQALLSRADTIKQVHYKLINMFDLLGNTPTRLWHHYTTESYELYQLMSDPKLTVADYDISEGQMLMLERKANLDWLYDGKPFTPGLRVLSGITSYMSSVLQCLFNTTALTDYFMAESNGGDKLYMKDINNMATPFKGSLAGAYGELLDMMWNGDSSNLQVPDQLKRIVNNEFSDYLYNADPHHFLAFLLNGLHENLNCVRSKPDIKMAAEVDERQDIDIATEAWHNHLLHNRSVIVTLFQGQLKSTLTCLNCGKVVQQSFEEFMSISLPICEKRSVFVYLVHADPLKTLFKYRLVVPKVGSILKLKQAMEKLVGINPMNMCVVDVYHSRFHKIYKDTDAISQIKDTDETYIYELPKPFGDTEWVSVPVYMREIKVQTSYSFFMGLKSTTKNELFGRPIVVTIHRNECEYKELLKTILTHCQQYITLPLDIIMSNDLVKLVQVDSYGLKEVQKLNDDDDEYLKLTSDTYVSCDWSVEVKKKYYNLMKAKDYTKHNSCFDTPEVKRSLHTNIYESLDHFFQFGEQDPWICPNCQFYQQVFKKVDIWRLPEVLLVHLRRPTFYSSFDKTMTESTEIHFPSIGLDLSKYLVYKSYDKPVYDLFAVLFKNTRELPSDPLYTAYCKNRVLNEWYSLDDISKIDERKVCFISSSTCLLFYSRRS